MNSYLKKNSLVREDVINYKLIFELKKAAASHEYHLKTYLPAVDIDGYDLIVDDGSVMKKIQIKTTLDSTTNNWLIHKSMLLPGYFNHEDYGFQTLCPSTPGCVLMLQIKSMGEDMNVEYYFTDINIITLMALGFLFINKESTERSKAILKTMKTEIVCRGKIKLTKGMFIKLRNAESILTIAGFNSTHKRVTAHNMWQIIRTYYRPDPIHKTLKDRAIYMTGHMLELKKDLNELLHDKFKIDIRSPKDALPHWLGEI